MMLVANQMSHKWAYKVLLTLLLCVSEAITGYALPTSQQGVADSLSNDSECYRLMQKANKYLEAGSFKRAIELAEESRKCMDDRGLNSPKLLGNILYVHSSALSQMGELEKAHELYSKEYEYEINETKPDSLITLQALIEMGTIRRQQGEFVQAIEQYVRADELIVKLHDAPLIFVETAYSGLAMAYRGMPVYPKYDWLEMSAWRKLMAIWDKRGTFDEKHKSYSIVNIARTCSELYDGTLHYTDTTRIYYAWGLKETITLFGHKSREAQIVRKEFADWMAGDWFECEHITESWDTYREYFGIASEAGGVLQYLEVIDSFIINNGSWLDECVGEDLTRFRLLLLDSADADVHDSTTARFYLDYGEALQSQERFKQSRDAHETAINLLSNTLGSDHKMLGLVYHRIAMLYKEQGKYPEFKEFYDRGMSIFINGTATR